LFCIHCGTRVGEITEAAARESPVQWEQPKPLPAQPIQPEPAAPYQAQYQYQQATVYPPYRKEKNIWRHFVSALEKYSIFSGRARRAEFWGYTLFCALFSILLQILARYYFNLAGAAVENSESMNLGLMSFSYIADTVIFLLPSFAVSIRRMHDCGKSGWYLLIPIYGWIILPCTEGARGPNRYGPDPKQTD
jgi:uncharacterized membrane protein YhaH (DUF805 family)